MSQTDIVGSVSQSDLITIHLAQRGLDLPRSPLAESQKNWKKQKNPCPKKKSESNIVKNLPLFCLPMGTSKKSTLWKKLQKVFSTLFMIETCLKHISRLTERVLGIKTGCTSGKTLHTEGLKVWTQTCVYFWSDFDQKSAFFLDGRVHVDFDLTRLSIEANSKSSSRQTQNSSKVPVRCARSAQIFYNCTRKNLS